MARMTRRRNTQRKTRRRYGGDKYPPCFEVCGLARNMYDTHKDLRTNPTFEKLMKLYSEVFCVEMKKVPIPPNTKEWLKSHFDEGAKYVKELKIDMKTHKMIEDIHTKSILGMVKA